MEPTVNPAVIEFFKDVTDDRLCIGFINRTWNTDIPDAAELMEKWCESENNQLRVRAAEALVAIRMRESYRRQSRDLLLQLAEGTVTPDELLPKSVPWIWVDGKYIQR